MFCLLLSILFREGYHLVDNGTNMNTLLKVNKRRRSVFCSCQQVPCPTTSRGGSTKEVNCPYFKIPRNETPPWWRWHDVSIIYNMTSWMKVSLPVRYVFISTATLVVSRHNLVSSDDFILMFSSSQPPTFLQLFLPNLSGSRWISFYHMGYYCHSLIN